MAPQPMPWLRLYTSMARDHKVQRLAPQERWVWVAVLCAARESNVPGVLMISDVLPMTDGEIAAYAGVSQKTVSAVLPKMVAQGMLERDESLLAWRVVHWEERQPPSDNSTQRVALHRARVREASPMQQRSNGDVTAMQRPRGRGEGDGDPFLGDEASPRSPRSDPLFEAIAEACGIDRASLTRSARGELNQATKDLREVDATPEEIASRAKAYRRKFRDAELTPSALAKHWATVVSKQTTDQPGPRVRTKADQLRSSIDAAKRSGDTETVEALEGELRAELERTEK